MFSLKRIVQEKQQKKELRKRGSALHAELIDRVLPITSDGRLGIEDGFELRFEVLVLLVSSMLIRLHQIGKKELAATLWEITFEGFDHSLRQQGVTDMAIGKRMRKLLLHATGRRTAYIEAMEKSDIVALEEAIQRNVLSGASKDVKDPMPSLLEAIRAVDQIPL
ncbi:MAG: ubiquinol-cytochrome C chaperone family protein [Magnetococcales bacterium]|nr:ubiquinol-cytochrome C chaperone family protein [Magnetococcales bacterium]